MSAHKVDQKRDFMCKALRDQIRTKSCEEESGTKLGSYMQDR